jgi:hypothetical protein
MRSRDETIWWERLGVGVPFYFFAKITCSTYLCECYRESIVTLIELFLNKWQLYCSMKIIQINQGLLMVTSHQRCTQQTHHQPLTTSRKILIAIILLVACYKKYMSLPFFIIFFDKGNILISWRYQLHLASATTQYPIGNTDAHVQKRKKNYKKISHYSDLFLVAAEINLLQKRRPKKRTVNKRLHCPDHTT